MGLLASWMLPERSWDLVVRIEASLHRRVGPLDRQRLAHARLHRLYGFRELRPDRRARKADDVPITMIGLPRLEAALEGGHGAILWIGPFVHAPLVAKLALARHGHAVSHLSRIGHGFGTSRVAVDWLNPLWTKVEERHLGERIVMHAGQESRALRCLRRRLADNSVVSITVGQIGAQTVSVPFLTGELRVATGPLSLSFASRAPLLPLTVLRTAVREFTVEILSPIAPSPSADRQVRLDTGARQLAARLIPHAARYPDQWVEQYPGQLRAAGSRERLTS